MDNEKLGLREVGGDGKMPASFRLDRELLKRLHETARKRKVTITSIVEMSIERGLKLLETK